MATVYYILLVLVIGGAVVRAGEYCLSHNRVSWCEGYCCNDDNDCCGEWIALAVGLSVAGFFVVIITIVIIICCYNNHKRKGQRGNVINPAPGPSMGMVVYPTAPPPYGGPYSGPKPGPGGPVGPATYQDPHGVHQPMAAQGAFPLPPSYSSAAASAPAVFPPPQST